MNGPARRTGGLTLAVVLALLVAACTGGEEARPDPGPRPPTTTTTRVDLSDVDLARVPGETTTTTAQGGRASIVGTVRGPGGAVPGAIVRIERLGPGEGPVDLVTDPEGRYAHRGVPGGRYRLRAFLPPTLAQVEPEVRFLADAQEHTVDLEVDDRTGPVVSASAAPDPPAVGQPVNLVVQIGTRRVDGDGIVRTEPVSGLRVELTGLGRWQLFVPTATTTTTSTTLGAPGLTTTTEPTTTTTAPPASEVATTDGAGRVRFALVCRAAGAPGLGVRFAVRVEAPPPPQEPAEGEEAPPATAAPPLTRTEQVALDLPACFDPTATTAPPDADGGTDTTGTDTTGTDTTRTDTTRTDTTRTDG